MCRMRTYAPLVIQAVLACILSIACAVVCSMFCAYTLDEPESRLLSEHEAATINRLAPPDCTLIEPWTIVWSGVGVRWTGIGSTDANGTSVTLIEAGLPLPCLRGTVWKPSNAAKCHYYATVAWRQRYVPLQPIWTALVMNTCILWLVIAGVHYSTILFTGWRRSSRVRPGRCGYCGHPLLPQQVQCSECGRAPLLVRPRLPT